ncbi:ATP-NAD kinase [Ensifer sp. MJa1]|uniref:ATP-NAD kinase n=1 Tax=Ensifer sp. MJa1 TaxID=2919888 RepID=UPI00300AD7B1
MKITFLASPRPAAQEALEQFVCRYGQSSVSGADYVVAIGGDGTALKALHALLEGSAKPVFPMRTQGSIGSLCNPLQLSDLMDRLIKAIPVDLPVLQADVERLGGERTTVFAINEIVLTRQRLQQARFKLTVDGGSAPATIAGDGLALVTPLGSTGYNQSLGGPRLPLGSHLLALTGIALTPRFPWHRSVVHDHIILDIEVVEPEHHPVQVETVVEIVPGIRRARLSCSGHCKATLLLDREVLNSLTAFHGQIC